MNKKGDFVILGVIIGVLLLLGVIYVEDRLGTREINVRYIGDNSSMVAYNLQSDNPNCNWDNIGINKNDIRYFNDRDEAISEGYNINTNCN